MKLDKRRVDADLAKKLRDVFGIEHITDFQFHTGIEAIPSITVTFLLEEDQIRKLYALEEL